MEPLPIINYGGYGTVYRVSKRRAMKVIHEHMDDAHARSMLEKECAVAATLHRNGVSVPEPFGVKHKRFMLESGDIRIAPGFIMRYVDGIAAEDIVAWCGKDIARAQHVDAMWSRELERASELFRPYDWIGNYVYEPKEDKVYLIDFWNWKRRGLVTQLPQLPQFDLEERYKTVRKRFAELFN